MAENNNVPDSAANDLKKSAEGVSPAASDTMQTAKEKLEKLGDEAEKAWDKVEDKAEELWDKAKSGELADEAKEKLSDLADSAKGLWNKLVDKLDGDNEEEAQTKP